MLFLFRDVKPSFVNLYTKKAPSNYINCKYFNDLNRRRDGKCVTSLKATVRSSYNLCRIVYS